MQIFQRKGSIAALAATVGLLVGVIAATSLFVHRHNEDQSWVVHTLRVQARLSKISALLQDAETAQRGYLITANERFYDTFQAATAAVRPQLDELQPEIADNPKQGAGLESLRYLAADRIAFLRQAVDLQHAGDAAAATALIKTGRGKALMDRGLDAIAIMQAEEDRLLSERQAQARSTAFTLQAVVGAALALALALGWFVLSNARQQFNTIANANEALAAAARRSAIETEQREKLEGQLRQSQKMEAVGQLTGGIAHDFNNMLAVVIGSLQILKRRLERGDADVLRFADNAVEGAERAAVLTRRLLAFSRQQPLEPQPVDCNKFVGGVASMVQRTLGAAIEVETVLAAGLWRTHVDPGQLESAVLNLAVNARDAMPEGGKLTIETANASLDEAYVAGHLDLKPGQYVLVSVTDTGCGMPSETVAKAFDPFFTTKEVGKGTGLGLSQVYGFVKQSGGHCKIYSEPGEGTSVKIYLPRFFGAAAGADAPQPADAAIPLGNAEETVLVVEDDERMLRMTAAAFRELGYSVVEANGPGPALAAIDGGQPFAMLFTDIVMPGMNGRKLAAEALDRRPDLKIIYTTGFSRNAIIHGGVVDPDVDFLAKPFTLEQLAMKVRSVLG